MKPNNGTRNAQLVLDRYQVPDDPILQEEHAIKPFVEKFKGKTPVSMLIGTDGAAKGAAQTPDGKSFAGWGFYGLMTYASGRSSVATYSGFRNGESFMFNESPLMAELVAIREAVKFVGYPTNLKIVTDCKAAIKLLNNHDQAAERMERLKADNPGRMSKGLREELRYLEIISEISDKLNNGKVLGFSMQWVGSHVMDDLSPEELPRIQDGATIEDQKILAHLLVNCAADALANEGVRSATRASFRGLRFLEPGTSEWGNKTRIASKNFYYSAKTTRDAVDYLAGQPPGYVPDKTIAAVLGDKALEDIQRFRAKQLENEKNGDTFLPAWKIRKQEERSRYNRAHEILSEFANVEVKNNHNQGQKMPNGKVRYDNPSAKRSGSGYLGRNRMKKAETPGLG